MALALISPLEPQLQRYFLLCEQYKCAPNPAVTLSLKYPGVTFIAPDKPFCPSELIPLCEVLKTDTTVQSLDFRRCKIGSSGCYALKMLLEHNSTLRQLNLPYNDIGEHGAQALAEGDLILKYDINLLLIARICAFVCFIVENWRRT